MVYYRDMDVFSALSDPTRRSILEMLAGSGSLSATDIYARFPASPPAISQHLKVLREANLVIVEKRAQFRLYRVNPEAMHELEDWVKYVTRIWEERFTALDEVLREEQEKLNQPNGMEGADQQ